MNLLDRFGRFLFRIVSSTMVRDQWSVKNSMEEMNKLSVFADSKRTFQYGSVACFRLIITRCLGGKSELNSFILSRIILLTDSPPRTLVKFRDFLV